MGASFGHFYSFFSDWPQEWFLGAKSGHFGCHLEASGVHLGVFLVGFGAICVRKRNFRGVQRYLSVFRTGLEYFGMLFNPQQCLALLGEYLGIIWNA